MWYGNGWMFGMHLFWWFFWVLLAALLVIALLRQQPGPPPPPRERTPLEILEGRYAAGEISTEEFEERKARLTGRKTESLAH